MHEALHLGRGLATNRANLLKRECSLQNHTRKARVGKESGQLGGAHLHLGRGMEFAIEPHATVGHILHNEGIHPRSKQGSCLLFGRLELRVPQEGIHRGIDLHPVAVGIGHHAGNFLGGIRCRLTRAKARAPDVEGIGAIIHSRHGRFIILGRSQQFDAFHSTK